MAGIYVHIPFCSKACHYCDFHFSTSFKHRTKIINAIQRELLIEHQYLKGELVDTIYFGGGTPSLLPMDLVKNLLNTIRDNFLLSESIECTLEANPEDITELKLKKWYNLGINRISLGVQSFRDKDLIYMNRAHTKRQAINSIELIKKSKIKNINVDLIYGFPLLENSAWIENLEIITNFSIPHVSCYCLTVEKNTPLFYFIKKKQYNPLNPNTGKEHFLIAREKLIKHGYNHYEISNFSKTGYQSKHNKNYWNQTNYLGVGPSAHSFNGLTRRWNINNNSIYLKNMESDTCVYKEEILTKKNIINEYILTSIRTSLGMNRNYLYNKMSIVQQNFFKKEINKLEKKKLIDIKGDVIYLTEHGMLFADSISEKLFII